MSKIQELRIKTESSFPKISNPILRLPEVSTATGYSKSSIYRLEKAGQFPKRRKLGVRSVGWLASDIREWLDSRQLA